MRWQDVYSKFGNDRQSGFGLHDSPNKYLNPPNVTNHARTLKRYGIDNYKILADADNKKAGRVQIYRQHGIHSIVRTHVDRPTPNYVIDLQVAKDYVNAGAWAIEPMNEPNLRDEWREGTFPASWQEYGRIVARQWMRNADVILAAGGVPVTPALSPGGHVPHREATLRFLEGINFHGGRGQLDRAVIGVHWRPLNNPIDTPPGMGNPPNTTLWRENEWFFATYSEFLGYMPGFAETESGYSPGSSENGTFPPMTQATWASFNRELYSRLNPSHSKVTPGQVICQDYWIEGTDGSGVWRIDAAFINWLEDNQPPDEPLWGKSIRTMGVNWDRKALVGATPPNPNPVPPNPNPTPPLPDRVVINKPPYVSFVEPTVQAGSDYYELTRFKFVDEAEAGGKHAIYILDPHNPSLKVKATNTGTGQVSEIPLDKPLNEPAANIPMFGIGNVYDVEMIGLPSVKVVGMKMEGNRHVCFELTYERRTKAVTVPNMTTRFIELARAEFGTLFEDLRASLPKKRDAQGNVIPFNPIDSRTMPYICFHHSATPINTTWLRVAEHHVNTNGWNAIGYALGVRLGKLALLGDLDTIRAHVLGKNHLALGTCIMGNYDSVPLSAENLDIMKRLVKVLDELYATDKTLTDHNTLLGGAYTACPGSAIKQAIPTLRTVAPQVPDWRKVVYFGEQAVRKAEAEGLIIEAEWMNLNWVKPAIVERKKVYGQ